MYRDLVDRLRKTFSRRDQSVPDISPVIGNTSVRPASKKPTRILNSRPSPWGQIIHPAPGELYEVFEAIAVSYVIEERFGTYGGDLQLPVGARVAVWSGIFNSPFDPLPTRVPCDYADSDPKRTAQIRRSMGLDRGQTNYHLEIEIEHFVLGHLHHVPD